MALFKLYKLTHDEKRTTKLTINDIIQLRLDYLNNPNYKIFAEKYNVTQSTIRYWVDDDYKQDRKEKALEYRKNRLEKSKEEKKHIQILQKISTESKYKNFPRTKVGAKISWEKLNKEYRDDPKNTKKIKIRGKIYRGKPKTKQWRKEYISTLKFKIRNRELVKQPKRVQYRKKYSQRDYVKEKHRLRQKEYRKNNIQKCTNESHRQGRIRYGTFFKNFWNLIEPDTRTKKQIHNDQMKRWRLENPEKQKVIEQRYRMKTYKQYYLKNKEKINEKAKIRYQKNKELK